MFDSTWREARSYRTKLVPVQCKPLLPAASFAAGAVLPVAAALLTPRAYATLGVAGTSLVVLTALGVIGARAGGAPPHKAAIRTLFWGSVAMAATALIGRAVGAVL